MMEDIHSFSPIYQSGCKDTRARVADFDFPDLQMSSDYNKCKDDVDSNEIEFHSEEHIGDDHTAVSYPFWVMVPRDPGSETTAVPDRRQALMELIENMPESSYELSFKEYVKVGKSMENSREGLLTEERRIPKSQDKIERKDENSRNQMLSRRDSMDSGNFLLKVFVPVPLSSKTKSSCSDLPRFPLVGESKKPSSKEWWKMACLDVSEKVTSPVIQRRSDSISTGSSSTTNSSRRWFFERNSIPGREYFSRKYISPVLRGCLF